MQSVEVLRIYSEDGVVDPLGFAEPPLLMQRERLLDRRQSRQCARLNASPCGIIHGAALSRARQEGRAKMVNRA